MPVDGAAKAVQDFFSITPQAGLVLPSGWFGRPYDNLLELASAHAVENDLRVELDSQIVLIFSGATVVDVSERGLTLRGFDRVVVEWVEYGSTRVHSESFDAGVVELIAPPG